LLFDRDFGFNRSLTSNENIKRIFFEKRFFKLAKKPNKVVLLLENKIAKKENI
jgi:hypothetical protein